MGQVRVRWTGRDPPGAPTENSQGPARPLEAGAAARWKLKEKLRSTFLKIKWTLTENQIILVRKIKISEDFLQVFGMWIVEEISEKSVKFRQNLVNDFEDVFFNLGDFEDVV